MSFSVNSIRAFSLSALTMASLSGCITVSEFQDARVLEPGEVREVVGVGLQMQAGSRLTLDDSASSTRDERVQGWPILPLALVGIYRERRGLSPWLETQWHITSPLIFDGLAAAGAGLGFKAQLWGADREAMTAGALIVRIEGYGILLVDDAFQMLGAGLITVGAPMSLYTSTIAVTLTPKAMWEVLGGAGEGVDSASNASLGASLGLLLDRTTGGPWLEVTLMGTPTTGGLMTTVGVAYPL